MLAFVEYYLPGYTAGGPIRTISNLVDQIGEHVRFTIVTRHSDPRDPGPYEGIQTDRMVPLGRAQVYYASPARLSVRGMRALLCELEHDVLYLNSLTSPRFTLLPLLLRYLRLVPRRPVVLAPRGELDPGALAIGSSKKRLFLGVSRFVGLYRGVIWQATNEQEGVYIRRWFGDDVRVENVANLPAHHLLSLAERPRKEAGRLRICFISRLARKKNLDGALRMLQAVSGGEVVFDIYGSREDPAYWSECEALISQLPSNVAAAYRGALHHERVRDVMGQYDLFFFPTHGENFGHVIAEALSAGCPVLISDRTPWRDLARRHVGWDVSLDHPDNFREVLEKCIRMDETEMAKWRTGAQAHIRALIEDGEATRQSRFLFERAVSAAAVGG